MKKIRLIGLLLLSILLSLFPKTSNAQVGSDSGSGAIVIGSRNSSGGSAVITGGTCTNSVVTAIGPTGVPTCTASPNITSLTVAAGTGAAPSIMIGSAQNGFFAVDANYIGVASGGASKLEFGTGGIFLKSTGVYAFSTTSDPNAAADLYLRRSAAKTLMFDTDGAAGALNLVDMRGPLAIDIGGSGSPYITFNQAVSQRAYIQYLNSDSGFHLFNGKQILIASNGVFADAPLNVVGLSNGQNFGLVQSLTELTTIAAAATTDTTIQMPAGAVVLAVSVRVTTVIPTCATFTVGDSGSAARFSTTTVSCAATSTDAGTKAGAYYNAGALSIRITPNATPASNTGRVRVTIYYYTVTPPTS